MFCDNDNVNKHKITHNISTAHINDVTVFSLQRVVTGHDKNSSNISAQVCLFVCLFAWCLMAL